MEEEEAAREPEIKYVYGAESEAFPGLVKIGYALSLDTATSLDAAQSIRHIKPDVFDMRNKMILKNVCLFLKNPISLLIQCK